MLVAVSSDQANGVARARGYLLAPAEPRGHAWGVPVVWHMDRVGSDPKPS